jgi:hypothetical protein
MNEKHESKFATAFVNVATVYGCHVDIIPDVIPLKRYGRIVAHKRPYDAVLVTPDHVYCIEFKYQFGKLKLHQHNTGKRINKINQCYYVVRKKVSTKLVTTYQIENIHKLIIFKSHSLADIIDKFKQGMK